VKNWDGEWQNFTLRWKIIDSTGLFLTPWRTAKERGYGDKDRGQFGKEGYIFGVNGAVAFIIERC